MQVAEAREAVFVPSACVTRMYNAPPYIRRYIIELADQFNEIRDRLNVGLYYTGSWLLPFYIYVYIKNGVYNLDEYTMNTMNTVRKNE